jgi:hypothetical protein
MSLENEIKSLINNPKFSELVPITYNMFINAIDLSKTEHKTSTYDFIDLEKLVSSLKLDNNFISKSLYLKDKGYNDPAEGPIDKYFICIKCRQIGPAYHLKNCTEPFTDSLFLTEQGAEKYSLNEGDPYNLAVVKRGQKKVESKSTKRNKFMNAVTLRYFDEKNTIIRISKNGFIHVLSAGFDIKKLPQQIINKINETNALNMEKYKQVYPNNNKLEIDPDITFKYLLSAQFNIYPKKYQESAYINLNVLDYMLRNSMKKINRNNIIFTSSNDYYIDDYSYNSGNFKSRSNKLTNPIIKFNLVLQDNQNFKINIQIYKRGAIQLKLSYIDYKNVDLIKNKLDYNILTDVYNFLKKLLKSLINESTEPIIVYEMITTKKKITNTVDGKEPQACQDRDGYKRRPVPYSFSGKCPDKDMYVRPVGMRRSDGLYEPCCYKMSKTSGKQDSTDRYFEILKNGYPDKESIKWGEEVPDPDDLSAVYKPGTKILESRRFKGLNSLDKSELIDYIEETGNIHEKDIFDISHESSDYNNFASSVLKDYQSLTGFNKILTQSPVSMNYGTYSLLSKQRYLVTPINEETIKVILFFNTSGKSFFINENNDVSESSLPESKELSNTIIEGYLYPGTSEFIFYPIDIIYLNGKSQISLNYLNGNESRFNNLNKSVGIISNISNLDIQFESRFDLNVIDGVKYILSNPNVYGDISKLLFIPLNGNYLINKINNKLLLWNDINDDNNKMIQLNVEKINKNNNIWEVSIDSKKIPNELLPQKDGGIELLQSVVKQFEIKNNDLILFEINTLSNSTSINKKTPLKPILKLSEKINDYQDVINILQSIHTPLLKSTLLNVNSDNGLPNGITIQNKRYYYPIVNGNPEINKPLHVINVN